MNKTEVATVTTAVPLTKELEAKVLAKVKELTGNDVSLENKIDENIIGGFILRVGDLQYNASIANKLNTLKREFTNNTYVSKL
jgi:F-type H+-transporting ATPase subunit delta